MEFDVYCDESRPDLLSSKNPQAKYMLIGSLWLETSNRQSFKDELHQLRDEYKIGGEFKWQKLSPSRLEFYKALVNWFVEKGDALRFRSVVVDHEKVNLVRFHHNDQELGFYKFYYQMLHHWILDFNKYHIFCDYKVNREKDQLRILHRCLSYTNISAKIDILQAIKAKESVLMQLVDVLTGITAVKLNGQDIKSYAKREIVAEIETRLGKAIAHTYKGEKKFNVFVMDLKGGW